MSPSPIHVRPLAESEADLLSAMNESWLPAHVFSATPYSCAGYGAYVRTLLSAPPGSCESSFHAADSTSCIVGYLELRRAEMMLISNIFVGPAARDQGVGTRLLRHVALAAREHGHDHVALD